MCCCASDPLDIIVRAPVSGYTPGQTINVHILVNNQSNQAVSDFVVQMIKVSITYNEDRIFGAICHYLNCFHLIFSHFKEIRYSDRPHSPNSKLQTGILVEMNTKRGCNLNSKATLRANIVVPSVSPTQTTSKHIIQIEYSIQVRASFAI